MAMLRAALAGLLAMAASSARAGSPGEAGASFLRFGAGPRAVGMGEAQTAAADDAYAAYWNPAGLAELTYPQVGATHSRSFAGVDHQYLSVAVPLRYGSTLDLNLTRLGMTSFDSYDAQGTRTGETDAGDYAVGAAFGQALRRDPVGRPVLSLGAGVKGIQERLGPVTAWTFAADVGFMAVRRRAPGSGSLFPGQEWRLGLLAANLGPALRFDRDKTPLPTVYRFGVAWRARPKGDALTLTVDQVYGQDEPYHAAFGGEYEVWRILALRVGYRTGQDIGSGFRAGMGFRLKVATVDYGFAGFGDLGQMHRFGVTLRLGGPVEATPDEEKALGVVMKRAERLLGERRFYEALLEYNRALDLDPGNRAAVEGMRKAGEGLADGR